MKPINSSKNKLNSKKNWCFKPMSHGLFLPTYFTIQLIFTIIHKFTVFFNFNKISKSYSH